MGDGRATAASAAPLTGAAPPPRSRWARFARFAIVGASGMPVDYAVFILVKSLGLVGQWSLGPLDLLHANMVSVAVAIQNNFLWNRVWTFRDRRGNPLAEQWLRFNLASLSTWLLNNLIVGALDGPLSRWLPAIVLGSTVGVYVAKAIAIGVCMAVNYVLSTRVAFR
ncbi:MAG: GtrA family protein [Planctomycetales bacterium]|nr:GtrA family protein [Planctomycetales bacterium]